MILHTANPFQGLDADARQSFRLWLSEVRDAGTTILAALNDDGRIRDQCVAAEMVEVTMAQHQGIDRRRIDAKDPQVR